MLKYINKTELLKSSLEGTTICKFQKENQITLPMAMFSFAKASTWKNTGKTCINHLSGTMDNIKINETLTSYLLLQKKQHNLKASPLVEQEPFLCQQMANRNKARTKEK